MKFWTRPEFRCAYKYLKILIPLWLLTCIFIFSFNHVQPRRSVTRFFSKSRFLPVVDPRYSHFATVLVMRKYLLLFWDGEKWKLYQVIVNVINLNNNWLPRPYLRGKGGQLSAFFWDWQLTKTKVVIHN